MTQRNPAVDAWFTERSHPLEAEMRRVRDLILSVDDRIAETVKWKTPTFEFNGNIASFNPSKNFVSLMFHRGAEIPGTHPRLRGDGKLVRTMRFADLDDVSAAADDLTRVIRAWCEANQ